MYAFFEKFMLFSIKVNQPEKDISKITASPSFTLVVTFYLFFHLLLSKIYYNIIFQININPDPQHTGTSYAFGYAYRCL